MGDWWEIGGRLVGVIIYIYLKKDSLSKKTEFQPDLRKLKQVVAVIVPTFQK